MYAFLDVGKDRSQILPFLHGSNIGNVMMDTEFTDSAHDTSSKSHLTVFGYLRKLESKLKMEQFIPYSVGLVCWQFYRHSFIFGEPALDEYGGLLISVFGRDRETATCHDTTEKGGSIYGHEWIHSMSGKVMEWQIKCNIFGECRIGVSTQCQKRFFTQNGGDGEDESDLFYFASGENITGHPHTSPWYRTETESESEEAKPAAANPRMILEKESIYDAARCRPITMQLDFIKEEIRFLDPVYGDVKWKERVVVGHKYRYKLAVEFSREADCSAATVTQLRDITGHSKQK